MQEEPGAPLRALGFVWREGEFTLIEPVVGHDTSGVGDINRVGQVTGLSVVQGSTLGPGYVWQDGLTHDLNDLVLPGSALVIRGGTGINDAGQIIANGLALNGDPVTFLLTPIDRPGTSVTHEPSIKKYAAQSPHGPLPRFQPTRRIDKTVLNCNPYQLNQRPGPQFHLQVCTVHLDCSSTETELSSNLPRPLSGKNQFQYLPLSRRQERKATFNLSPL